MCCRCFPWGSFLLHFQLVFRFVLAFLEYSQLGFWQQTSVMEGAGSPRWVWSSRAPSLHVLLLVFGGLEGHVFPLAAELFLGVAGDSGVAVSMGLLCATMLSTSALVWNWGLARDFSTAALPLLCVFVTWAESIFCCCSWFNSSLLVAL